jgi:hypothetical protein
MPRRSTNDFTVQCHHVRSTSPTQTPVLPLAEPDRLPWTLPRVSAGAFIRINKHSRNSCRRFDCQRVRRDNNDTFLANWDHVVRALIEHSAPDHAFKIQGLF